jgi:hypothetical protein
MTLAQWISTTRVYCHLDAFLRDEFGRAAANELKPVHDYLFQLAIDLGLATTLVILDAQRRPREFKARLRLMASRPNWWAANSGTKNRADLTVVSLVDFDNSWRLVRNAAEAKRQPVEIWHADPALAFEPIPGKILARTATVGHEGQVFYFVYGKEAKWEDELKRNGMHWYGSGDATYRRFVREPGILGGTE